MELAGMHPETAQLAIQLQLADIELAMEESDEGDQWTAYKTMQDELQNALLLQKDQVFALNLLREDRDNQAAFAQSLQEERQAEEDHDLACRLSGIANEHVTRSRSMMRDTMIPLGRAWDDDQYLSLTEDVDPLVEITAILDTFEATKDNDLHSKAGPSKVRAKGKGKASNPSNEDEDALYTLKTKGKGKAANPSNEDKDALYTLKTKGKEKATISSHNNTHATRNSKGKGKEKAAILSHNSEHATHILCSACLELYPRFDALELDCRRPKEDSAHAYCRTCLKDLFQTSLADTTLLPPRCCGKILPISRCKELCPASLIAQYEDKQMERATPNPVYCSNRSCATFIKPCNIIADTASCQVCHNETCALCQNPRHNGVCPKDPSVQLLMDVASEEKWQRCPNCRSMVELNMGCFHVRCRCGTDFCYMCAKEWKTCNCPQWDEARLLNDGRVRHGSRNRIAMPEENEIPEADPNIDIFEDLRTRLATVAGGSAIVNDEDADEDVTQFTSECDHQWERMHGKQGGRETCGICHNRLKFVNSCTRCKTRVCNRCLNNRF